MFVTLKCRDVARRFRAALLTGCVALLFDGHYRADELEEQRIHTDRWVRVADVGIQRVDMMEPLLKNGARVDAAIWTRVICFAGLVNASDVRVPLERWRLRDSSVSCEGVSTPW